MGETVDTILGRSLKAIGNGIDEVRTIVRGFDYLDTTYIEPQHYFFTVMLQGSYIYDRYWLYGKEQSVTFMPEGDFRLGPYFGWKWAFAGYMLSLNHNNFDKKKSEIALSIYTSQIGIDLFYRRTGSDYKLRDANFGEEARFHSMEGVSFDGVKAGITGFSLYYIFNHGRFSYPAAFSQSTVQKRSCGSWMAGLGYTKNTLELDYIKLQQLLDERLAPHRVRLDSTLMFSNMKYHDFYVSCGYAYNWVFAPRWLFCASGQLALGYKKSTGEAVGKDTSGFKFENISPNMIGRFGLVYNNMRWYSGLSFIVHSNNYRRSHFWTNNTFGSMNMYVGYNFGLKKKYRKN